VTVKEKDPFAARDEEKVQEEGFKEEEKWFGVDITQTKRDGRATPTLPGHTGKCFEKGQREKD